MKKLSFRYEVSYSFSQPVTDHSYALRILPKTNEEQSIYASGYRISGGSSHALGTDGFGNYQITGRIPEAHDSFRFVVKGTAYVRRDGTGKRREGAAPYYRYPTDLTAPGPAIRAMFAEGTPEMSPIAWMHRLAGSFTYRSGVTGIQTTAESAAEKGEGVCQDYAHILIALLRMAGYPARYVAGMMSGEGVTHAWVEVWEKDRWIGLDPTHDRLVTEDYIEIAHGRDYRDCIMDRGIFRGYALQTQEVRVSVTEYQPGSVERLGIL